MEGNQPYHSSLIYPQGEPRLTDADRGVKLEVSDFSREGNPDMFFDWLHSIESFLKNKKSNARKFIRKKKKNLVY